MNKQASTLLPIRLDRFLATMGIAARRNIGLFLSEHQVTINGKRVLEPGIRFDPDNDTLLVDKQSLRKPKVRYIMLNKPKGVLSTTLDELGRKTVVSMVNKQERIYPVGRLDKDTTGLLLLTNDGDLANKLTHPRYHIPKIYQLYIQGEVTQQQIDALRTGVVLDDGKTSPAEAKIITFEYNRTTIHMTLFEGKKRQVRRMCQALHIDLKELKRIAMGPIELGDLPMGEYRDLTDEEINLLKQEAFHTNKKSVL